MNSKILYLALFVLLLILFPNLGETSEKRIFSDFESYKKSLNVGVSEKREIDINKDGKKDILVFGYGGEETFLTILISKNEGFVETEVPTGLEYGILGRGDKYYIKVGTGTFPVFGDIHGPDKYRWYDFYKVEGTELVPVNELHSSFYKEMIPVYLARISEIEKEVKSQRTELIKQGNDPETVDMMLGLKLDHVERYRNFIKQAKEIIESSEKSKKRLE